MRRRSAMSDFTYPQPVLRPEPSAGTFAADATEIVEIVLEGGPDSFPTELRTRQVPLADSKIKVPHYGGYEHFERADAPDPGGVPSVFRWTGRTRVAE